MLTSKDFKITNTACPVCGKPARIFERNENSYLRCAWEDCRTNRNSCIVSMERFFSMIENYERKEVK